MNDIKRQPLSLGPCEINELRDFRVWNTECPVVNHGWRSLPETRGRKPDARSVAPLTRHTHCVLRGWRVPMVLAVQLPLALENMQLGLGIIVALALAAALLVPYLLKEIRRGKVELGPRN